MNRSLGTIKQTQKQLKLEKAKSALIELEKMLQKEGMSKESFEQLLKDESITLDYLVKLSYITVHEIKEIIKCRIGDRLKWEHYDMSDLDW